MSAIVYVFTFSEKINQKDCFISILDVANSIHGHLNCEYLNWKKIESIAQHILWELEKMKYFHSHLKRKQN